MAGYVGYPEDGWELRLIVYILFIALITKVIIPLSIWFVKDILYPLTKWLLKMLWKFIQITAVFITNQIKKIANNIKEKREHARINAETTSEDIIQKKDKK